MEVKAFVEVMGTGKRGWRGASREGGTGSPTWTTIEGETDGRRDRRKKRRQSAEENMTSEPVEVRGRRRRGTALLVNGLDTRLINGKKRRLWFTVSGKFKCLARADGLLLKNEVGVSL